MQVIGENIHMNAEILQKPQHMTVATVKQLAVVQRSNLTKVRTKVS